jgi:hypothetical protein
VLQVKYEFGYFSGSGGIVYWKKYTDVSYDVPSTITIPLRGWEAAKPEEMLLDKELKGVWVEDEESKKLSQDIRRARKDEGRCVVCGKRREMSAFGLRDCEEGCRED